ncbi:MAG TPA: RNA polymerase sigma factor [Isosphaeraceae bacterium]|jgi:RNA polymerase sigma factor (sigma-70 family)|nr:RNA polymerase sigma factor [Isosphaeraceae bacterium]
MASRPGGAVLGQLRRLLNQGTVAGLSEGQLLERFLARGDEAAFAAIVARHGPMVLAVCRRALIDEADAEDAFQATFLVLVRRARSIRNRESLASWLHGVAQRVAARARLDAARRRRHERAKGVESPTATGPEPTPDDFGPILHEELARLPEKYRAPLVLCYLEGHTHDQAADVLGWPLGTVRGRLARGRDQLRGRLARRGVGITGAVLVATLSSEATASVPDLLIESTTRAAALAAAGRLAVAGAVSAGAVRLWENALRSMLMSKLKGLAAVALVVAGLVVTGGGLHAYQAGGDRPKGEEGADRPGTAKADEPKFPVPPGAPATPEEQYRQYQRQPAGTAVVSRGDADLAQGGPTPKGNTPADRKLKAATRLFQLLRSRSEAGEIPVDGLVDASRRLLEAQQDLSDTPVDRLAAVRAHRNRMAKLLERVKKLAEAGSVGPETLALLEYALADADVLLAKAEAATKDERSGAAEGGDGPLEYQGDKDPKSRAILSLLDEPIAMSFPKETPLKDVLKYIRSKSESKANPRGINIYVDPSAVDLNNHSIDLDTPVTIDLEGVPLRRSLQLVLLPLGLSYGVVDGILVVSNQTSITNLQMHDPNVVPSPAQLKMRNQMRSGAFMGGMGGGMGGMGGTGGGMR